MASIPYFSPITPQGSVRECDGGKEEEGREGEKKGRVGMGERKAVCVCVCVLGRGKGGEVRVGKEGREMSRVNYEGKLRKELLRRRKVLINDER